MSDTQLDTGLVPQLWSFDQGQLRPGDIILERGHGKFSPLINLVDGGEYSHALLWLGGGDFLEAIGSGVRPISFIRVPVQNPGDWIVLRHPHAGAGAAAASESRALAHKDYDLWGAIKSPFPFARLDPTRLFCSQLVAVAYERAGFPLIAARAAHQITPNMLIRDASLCVVEPIPLKPVPQEKQEVVLGLIDRNRAFRHSPMAEEMRLSQEVLALVRPMFPPFVPPDGSGLSFPPANIYEAVGLLQLVDDHTARSISERMRIELGQRGYFGLADAYLLSTADRRMNQTARLKVKSIRGESLPQLVMEVREIQPGREAALERHENNAAAYREMLSQRSVRLFERLLEMHMKIVMHLHLIIRLEREILKLGEPLLDQTDRAEP